MLNKKEFIYVVSGTTGKSKKEVESAVDLVLEGIKYAYKYYDGVKFVGFGTFKKKTTKSRMGTDPNTLERIKIESNVLPKFIPGAELRGIFA